MLGVGFVDHDHEEAVAAINRLAAASVAERLEQGRAFAEHCAAHFGREEAMMRRTGFFALEPHSGEHRRVLEELAGILARLEAGDPCDEYFTVTLPQWFLEHRATMDFVTSDFALERGWKD